MSNVLKMEGIRGALTTKSLSSKVLSRAKELGLPNEVMLLPITYYYKVSSSYSKEVELYTFRGKMENGSGKEVRHIPYNPFLQDYLNEQSTMVIKEIKELGSDETLVQEFLKSLPEEQREDFKGRLDYFMDWGGTYRPIIGGPEHGKYIIRYNMDKNRLSPFRLESDSKCILPLFLTYGGDVKFPKDTWCVSIRPHHGKYSYEDEVEQGREVFDVVMKSNSEYVIQHLGRGSNELRELFPGEEVVRGSEGTLEYCQELVHVLERVYEKGREYAFEQVISKANQYLGRIKDHEEIKESFKAFN